MSIDFAIGLLTGIVLTMALILIVESLVKYQQKKRRKIKDEWI